MFATLALLGACALPVPQDDPFADLLATPEEEQGEAPAPGRGGTYALRFADRQARLEGGGLGPKERSAIESGLSWLTAQQADDGSWGDARTTAFALLALLGDGHTTIDGEHTRAVTLGVEYLVGVQRESGALGETTAGHAPASLALSEAARFGGGEGISAAASRALQHLIAESRKGAWGDDPDVAADPVLTAWCALALAGGVEAGILKRGSFAPTAGWIKANIRDSGAVKRPRGVLGHRNRAVAALLYARQVIGANVTAPVATQAGRLVKGDVKPEWPGSGERADLEYWFWGTYGTHLAGRHAGEWRAALVEALLAHQSSAGGWPDVATEGESTGEAYSTALALLALEAPYRWTRPASAGSGVGAGGKFGGRFGGRRMLRAAGGAGTEKALADGLVWLARHQSQDGSWDCDGFQENNSTAACTCDGAGQATRDVGVTALALLAFLGDGNTATNGKYSSNVGQGIRWLAGQQDPGTGRIGPATGGEWIYDHILATLAMTECYYFHKSAALEPRIQAALDFLVRGQNKGAGFRYAVPATGRSDSSVTAWALFALKSAGEAGFAVDEEVLASVLAWYEHVTDSTTGRVGYDARGNPPARLAQNIEQFPSDRSEAMTAAGLMVRIFLGQHPKRDPILTKHASLLLACPPEWDEASGSIDMYYWYWASYASFQMGGAHWKAWNKAMRPVALDHQRHDGGFAGSWDPVGVWGSTGGRVYSTAMMSLTLEVYFRYAQVLGRR